MGAEIHLQNQRTAGGEPVADRWSDTPVKPGRNKGKHNPTLIDEIPILAVAMALA